jgi:hypothetical protein
MSQPVQEPTTPVQPPTALYRVRVPVVFDHLNEALRQQLHDRDVPRKQALGRGVAIMGDADVGKIEIWFELNRAADSAGRQQAADDAIDLVEEALTPRRPPPHNERTRPQRRSQPGDHDRADKLTDPCQAGAHLARPSLSSCVQLFRCCRGVAR